MREQTLTIEQRCDRLDRMVAEGRIIRSAWADHDADGRELACLLVALAPECAESEDSTACPAEVMPAWLAELTTGIDDYGSDGAWPAMVRRYADVARRWHALDAGAWRRLEYEARRIAIEEAMRHTSHPEASAACELAAALCRRAEVSNDPSVSEWESEEAMLGVLSASAEAAAAAASASWEAAAAAASWAAAAAASSATASSESPAAAAAAAWDRVTDALLTAIEAACDAAEAVVVDRYAREY